jgi:hypothetical protein
MPSPLPTPTPTRLKGLYNCCNFSRCIVQERKGKRDESENGRECRGTTESRCFVSSTDVLFSVHAHAQSRSKLAYCLQENIGIWISRHQEKIEKLDKKSCDQHSQVVRSQVNEFLWGCACKVNGDVNLVKAISVNHRSD